jgi:hypothetical protein
VARDLYLMEEIPTIEYAARPKKPSVVRLYGVLAILFCVLQLPWAMVVGWAYWAILWGDNQPPLGGFIMSFVGAAIPSLAAVSLGLVAIVRRGRTRFDAIAGMVGSVGGLIWLLFFAAMFLDQLKSRW